MTNCTITQSDNNTNQQKVARKPASNIISYEQHIELQLAIPGVAKDAVTLTSEGNKLRIEATSSGEGPWGNVTYQHEFALHKDLDSQGIEAALANGILSVRIPKHEAATAQRIEIQ